MVVFLFGYEINLMKKKSRGQGEVFRIFEEETPSQEMKQLLEAPLDIYENQVEQTIANN